MTWTDTSTMAITVNDLPRASWANAVVDNLAYLYDTPAVTVRMTSAQSVSSGSDTLISWSEAAWDTTGGDMWDSGSPGSILIPVDGIYRFTCPVPEQYLTDLEESPGDISLTDLMAVLEREYN